MKDILDRDNLMKIWRLMDDRNRQLGLARYDWNDLLSHPIYENLSGSMVGRGIIKLLRLPELLAPVKWRHLLNMPKRVIPTIFYHLGLSFLAREQLPDMQAFSSSRAEDICREALACQLAGEYTCWSHPYLHHGRPYKELAEHSQTPSSCAHHTARVGFMLLTLGEAHARPELIAAGVGAANALLAYHHWQWYDEGTCTVSYYPFSRDEVINTGADAAMLLAAVPPIHQTPEMQQALVGLICMVLSEQQPDGSWFYCTFRHYHKFGEARSIDNHHSAMIIGAMARILLSGGIDYNLSRKIGKSIDKGLQFYGRRLFTSDGTGLYTPKGGRETGVVGYSEGITAFCHCLRLPERISSESQSLLQGLLPKVVRKAIGSFLDPRTGDVACYKFFGRPYHIQSARWGSAPLMQAITDYLGVA